MSSLGSNTGSHQQKIIQVLVNRLKHKVRYMSADCLRSESHVLTSVPLSYLAIQERI
jgi:hypothetical protein